MSEDHSHTHIALTSTQKARYLTQTNLFVILKITRQINFKYHWEMESHPESFKGFTTIMSGDFPL